MAKPVLETAASTDLITIETLNAADVFKPGAVEKLIAGVEAKVRAIPAADHTTEKGRNEIKALAYKVTRSKTALDELGKNHVAELKKAAGVVDADRRIIRDRLDALKDKVRAPVDQYEAEEAGRIAIHTHCMEQLQALDTFAAGEDTIDNIDSRMYTLSALYDRDWEEFSDSAKRLIPKMSGSLIAMRADRIKQDEERAELELLRKSEAERQEAQRKIDAERERQKHEDRLKAKFKQEADARIAKAERDAKEAAEKAERDKAVAFEQAERNRKAAIETERKRVADAKAAEEAATRKREANKAYLMKINNAALTDMMDAGGITEKQGKAIIIAIASGKVANVQINY